MTVFAGIAGEIEAVIGATLTAKLLAARGGTVVFVPKHPKGTILSKIVGPEAVCKLIDAFGVGELHLPMGTARGRGAVRDASVQLFKDGKSLTEVAIKSGVHVRTASRWKKETKAGDIGLGPLFERPFDK